MNDTFIIAGRSSALSLAQMELFKQKALAVSAQSKFAFHCIETAGDKDQSKPLHLVEGSNFFTQDVQELLQKGIAHFAVHSMKDVSQIDFFKNSAYAIIDRNALHDITIFSHKGLQKLKAGRPICIGTSSPRRSRMAIRFLQNHLPQYHKNILLTATAIRGNVEVRLQKMEAGQVDAVILAAAGLNRLLQTESMGTIVKQILQRCKTMQLPLFDCPPALGQGAIVVEAHHSNAAAVALLQQVNDKNLTAAIEAERGFAEKFGYGCSQQFGAFHLSNPHLSFTYAAGTDKDGQAIEEWSYPKPVVAADKKIFDTSLYRQLFFKAEQIPYQMPNAAEVIFVASPRAALSLTVDSAAQSNVWAAGSKTWKALAAKGIWVQGAADELGIEHALAQWQRPLYQYQKQNILILTSTASATRHLQNGWRAIGTYLLHFGNTKAWQQEAACSDVFFWTGYRQYLLAKPFLKKDVLHFCLPGATADFLKAEGLHPQCFPSLKAFHQWLRALEEKRQDALPQSIQTVSTAILNTEKNLPNPIRPLPGKALHSV